MLTLVYSGLQGTPQKSVMSTEMLRMAFTGVPEQPYYMSVLLKACAARQCSPDSCGIHKSRRAMRHAVQTYVGHSKSVPLSLSV